MLTLSLATQILDLIALAIVFAITTTKENKMALFSNRTPPNAAPGAARAAAPPPPPRSRYGGITAAETRDPLLEIGTYRLQVLECAEGYNPGRGRESYKVKLQVLEAAEGSTTPAGTTVTVVHMINPAGLGELKRLAMAAAGFGPTLEQRANDAASVKAISLDGEARFNALDESFGHQGAIIEASAGRGPTGAPSIVGQLVDCVVSRHKDVINPQTQQPTGDYYRRYVWGVVKDGE